jgi:hypothetical protein
MARVRKVFRNGGIERLTKRNEGLTLKQLRAKRLARQPVEEKVVVQPGSTLRQVTVRGSDVNKINARNKVISDYFRGDKEAIDRFNKRYKRLCVIDRSVEEPQAVHPIINPDELTTSRDGMTKRQRKRLQELYAEEMAA